MKHISSAGKNEKKSGGISQAVSYAIIIIMVTGVVAGAVAANVMDSSSSEAVKTYITGFLGGFDRSAINQKASLAESLYKYARVIAVIWAAGLLEPGLVVAVCVILFKAFAYGFTTAALVRYFGFYGLVVGFSCYIPQNIFFLPAMLWVAFSAVIALGNKARDTKSAGAKQNSAGFAEYTLVLLTGLLCCVVAALIETYITPSLIEYITPV